MIRIALVEDQVMLRDSLAAAINAEPDMHVAVSLSDASKAVAAVEGKQVDLALLDVCTENNASGIVAARKLKEAYPDIKTVIMTGMPDVTFVRQAREADVDSFIYKNVGTKELLSVMRSTIDGYATFPQVKSAANEEFAMLTDVEIDILRLVCEAKGRKQIAAELYLSEGTVKRHISEILAKTGYDSILKLAVHAVSSGCIVASVERGSSSEV